MYRLFTLFVILLAFTVNSYAQNYAQISVGPNYTQQAFYTIENDAITTLNNETWDIAFSTNLAGAGVLINEAGALSSTAIIRLYLAPTNDFNATIDPITLTDSLYNIETSWEDGAFNSVADSLDPLDFGWGVYNPNTHVVNGSRVFVVQLRDGSWKKIKIESLDSGVFTFKYADLDGAYEQTQSINKSDFANSPLALFSFQSGTAVASPADWDLLFCRYYSSLDAGADDLIQYPVTGVLSGPGVEVAEARDINPYTVDHIPYLDSLESDLDVIGSDWKFFSLSTFMWEIDFDRAYFVKLPDNKLWKLIFLDFEGSSTGTSTIEKVDLGILSSVTEAESNFKEFGVFPNPVQTEIHFSFTLKEAQPDLPIYIINSMGQIVWQQIATTNRGLNVLTFQKPNLPAGVYQLMAGNGSDFLAIKIVL